MFFENSTSGLGKLIFIRRETPRRKNLKPFSENHTSLTWKTKPWREDNIQTDRQTDKQKVFLYVIEIHIYLNISRYIHSYTHNLQWKWKKSLFNKTIWYEMIILMTHWFMYINTKSTLDPFIYSPIYFITPTYTIVFA